MKIWLYGKTHLEKLILTWKEWSTGPSLNHGRGGHAVGIVTDEVTQDELIVVTGGFQINNMNYNTDFSNTTEVLFDGVWSIGKIIWNFPCLKKQDL